LLQKEKEENLQVLDGWMVAGNFEVGGKGGGHFYHFFTPGVRGFSMRIRKRSQTDDRRK